MDVHNQLRQPRVLVLEDSHLDAELIREHLETLKPVPEIRYAQNRKTYEEALDGGDYDVILADFSLPDFDGMSALELARDVAPEVPFIFVSGILGEEVAIESFRQGATDYVLKQRLIRLPAAVERALAEARERTERRDAERQKELLVRELSHRVKNTMAMVMSLVRRTVKTSSSLDVTLRTSSAACVHWPMRMPSCSRRTGTRRNCWKSSGGRLRRRIVAPDASGSMPGR
jgi:DNA-binding NtrC family response regulator